MNRFDNCDPMNKSMNDHQESVAMHFAEHSSVISALKESYLPSIERSALQLAQSLKERRTVFFCGNGGSAADSQHFAAELVGRFNKNRRALPSVSLSSDSSVLTCIANDFSYADIFARQLEALAVPGDSLVAISTSGRSPNILRAIDTAKSMGVYVIALLGKDGGEAKYLADLPIVVPSHTTARIQEAHGLIAHVWCNLIEEEMNLA